MPVSRIKNTIKMTRLLFIALLLAASFANGQHLYKTIFLKTSNTSAYPATEIDTKGEKFGISIHLYRTDNAESIDDLKDLDAQIAKRADTELNLGEIGEDLAMIFLNSTNQFIDQKTFPIKMLYGFRVQKDTKNWQIGGFLLTKFGHLISVRCPVERTIIQNLRIILR